MSDSGADFDITELCAAARREVAQRKKVYPRLVRDGKMDPEEARRQIAMMEAITDLLESQQQPKLF
jgi:hypothetical protein